MHIQRLKQLREIVSRYINVDDETPVKLNGESRSWNMHKWDCGTSACAWGSYVISTYGKADGLAINSKNEVVSMTANDNCPLDAAADYFEISNETAALLFIPDEYPVTNGVNIITPEDVVTRIDFLLKAGEKEILEALR